MEQLKEKFLKTVQKCKEYVIKNKRLVCAVASGICFLIAVIMLIQYWADARRAEQKMEELRQQAQTVAEATPEPTTEPAATPAPTEEPEQEKVRNPYVDLFAQNSDMAGWLQVKDTKIDYPIMQTMENETYYIDKDFYGNYDKAGCLLLDTDSSLDKEGTTNLIIHGHNMKAGTMFGELELYEDAEYGAAHKSVTLYTEEDVREYEVISVFRSQVFYVTDEVFKYYQFFEADTEEAFADFYNNIKEMSLYDTGVTAELGDSFITLSTCAYHTEDGRFVVVAKETSRTPYTE